MECWVRLGDGRALNLPTPLEWNYSYGTGLPCDSFFVRCPWEPGQEEALSAAALFYARWKGERVFTGVVDEYACVCGTEGLQLELSGRGMAARLLDNEAMPCRYQWFSAADLAANHVRPYGVQVVGGGALPAVSGFSVESGASQWSVVEDYAQYHGGVVPRFDRLGRLVLEPHPDDRITEIGPAAPVTAWEYRRQRYGVLSRVAVRQRSSWETCWTEDRAFLEQGGCASRVVTVPNDTGDVAMRYSADYQLKASRRERLRLILTVAGAFLAWPGDLVEVNRERFGGNGLYRVARTDVVCSSKGLFTTLELGEPESLI